MKQELYTLKEVSRFVSKTLRDEDVSYVDRQIKHWTSHDLLCPEGEKHTGTGRSRLYPMNEVIVAAYLHEFSQYGLTIGDLAFFRKNYDQWMKIPKLRDVLHGKTDRAGQGGYIFCNGYSDKLERLCFGLSPSPLFSFDELRRFGDEGNKKTFQFQSALIVSCNDVVDRILQK